MTCEESKALLPAFGLGACEDEVRAALEGHLSGCAACLRDYFSAKRVGESAAALDERPSAAVRQRVRAKAMALGLRAPRRRLGLVLGLAAAAALLVLLAVRLLAPAPALHAPPDNPGLVDSAPPSLDVF